MPALSLPVSIGQAFSRSVRFCAALLVVPLLAAGLAGSLSVLSTAGRTAVNAGPPSGVIYPLHVTGNHLIDETGSMIVLRGVNRSGPEYACMSGPTIGDGPLSAVAVAAMRAWEINAVRVPLNEDCWLGINGAAVGGKPYQTGISRLVAQLKAAGLYAILDLHISAPGSMKAVSQEPMPDADHAVTFWTSLAETFGQDGTVIFDLFNEPFPAANDASAQAWQCWRDGCTEQAAGSPYHAVGMNALLAAVRGRHARNVVMIGGIQFANTVDRWLAFAPHDPLRNLAAAQHFYANGACASPGCWSATTQVVAASVPLIAGEVGDTDCSFDNTKSTVRFLEAHHISYLAWTWGTSFGCESLIQHFDGTPTQPYGQWFHDWLRQVQHLSAIAEPLATYFNNVGVTADGAQMNCGFDDQNHCFSQGALRASGLDRAMTLTTGGIRLAWTPGPGIPDNVVAMGQTVAVTSTAGPAARLVLLGAASHGPGTAILQLRYTDGRTTQVNMSVPDWTSDGNTGGQALAPPDSILVQTSYRDKSDNTTDQTAAYLFAIAVPLDRTKTLSAIVLPDLPPHGNPFRVHVFALGVG